VSIHLGAIEFDWVDYDPSTDVLTLNVGGPPRVPDDIDESEEYHHLRYECGELVGLQILDAAATVKDDGVISVTVRGRRCTLDTEELAVVLAGTGSTGEWRDRQFGRPRRSIRPARG
jgi:hypothetical protein